VDHPIHYNLFPGFCLAHLEDVQNQTSILDDYSTTLCGILSILAPDREHASLLLQANLDFSSREDFAVRRHETCQTDNKKTRINALLGFQSTHNRRFND
jgi:hypothetical protein